MTRVCPAALVFIMMFAFGNSAAGQMVSATTGAIDGAITDASGVPLAGVQVTIYSPAMMGIRTTHTTRQGRYRFPALTPGVYKIACEHPEFTTRIFEGIRVALGFTATVNVEMTPADRREADTVADRSPVVDVRSTQTSTTLDTRDLAARPSARDMWAILAQAPAVQVSRIDVGGSAAGTQTGYQAYDNKGGQNRVVLDGLVTTEGTGSIGVYFDYGAVAESSTGTAGQSAELGWPGVHSQYIAKAGGNEFHATFYGDYQNATLQSRNIDDDQLARGAQAGEVNRMHLYNTVNADVGGYIRRDSAWWYVAYRRQDMQAWYPNFPVKPHATQLYNYSGKTTFGLSPNNRLIGYAQAVLKQQPNRLGGFQVSTPISTSADSTSFQKHWAWVGKAEWDHVVSDAMFFDVRGGQFGYNWPLRQNGTAPRVEDIGNGFVYGGQRDWQQDRRRNQVLGSLTIFADNWAGSHTFKFGGEVFYETEREEYKEGYPGNLVHILRNGTPIEVYQFGAPSESNNGLWTYSAYAADQWQIGPKLMVSPSARFDRYRAFLPAQEHPAGRFTPTAESFESVDNVIDFNHVAPRLGATYNVHGDGRTVLKASYGIYWWNLGTDFLFNVNPNSIVWWRRYQWTDANGSGVWDPGEEGRLLATRGGVALESLDPALENTYTRETAVWFERELMRNVSFRTGFVYRGIRQIYQRRNELQPFDAFNVPVMIPDPGSDGTPATGDDGPPIAGFNLDPRLVGIQPVNIVSNVGGANDYYTWEATANRRYTNGWSLLVTFTHRWNRENGSSYFGNTVRANENVLTPNDLIDTTDGRHQFTNWAFKVQSTFEAPWSVRLTPMLRHQSGQAWGRTFVANMNYGSVRVLAEPLGTRRQDNVTIVDVRAEKSFRAPRGVRVAGFFDLYNLLNANPEQNINWSSGGSFNRPLTIVPPRIARFGAKLEW